MGTRLCSFQMILSIYLPNFEFDPVLHSIHLGFLHSTFYCTMQAVMENTEQNWARNRFLLSSTYLTSSVWWVSPLFECSLSSLLCQPYSDHTQGKCLCLLVRVWGRAQWQGMLHLLLSPPLDHLMPRQGVDLTWPIFNKVMPIFNYLVF